MVAGLYLELAHRSRWGRLCTLSEVGAAGTGDRR
jgi:hypothetical protein